MNAENPPGSRASAHRSFSGGQDGPFIDEAIDAMGSASAVQALQRSFKAVASACRTVTLTVPGEGSSPMQVREASAADVGQNPVAVRFTATSGALEGFELTMVTTRPRRGRGLVTGRRRTRRRRRGDRGGGQQGRADPHRLKDGHIVVDGGDELPPVTPAPDIG